MRSFDCPATILNTLDSLGKFDGKVDEGFLVGCSVSSKSFRVFNSRTRIVQETLHVNFLENKLNVAGSGPTWLFDVDTLTKTMNYQPVTTGNQSNPSNTDGDVAFDEKEPEFKGRKPESEVNVSPSSSAQSKKHDDKTKRDAKGKSPVESLTGYINLSAEFEDFSDDSINEVNVVRTLVPAIEQISSNSTNTFSAAVPLNAAASLTHGKSSCIDTSQLPDDLNMPELEDITYFDDEEDVGAEADFNNLETSITVSPIPTTRVHKDHPVTQIIGDLSLATQTRSMTRVAKDQGRLSQINNDDFHTCIFACFLSQEEPKREEGIDYEEVFTLVARIKAIRLFLAYAFFMGFMVYQMDVKSAFLYGTIKEDVYVYQPLGFEDSNYPNKFYKVVKALYGLHQAPRAWYETLANYLLENGFQKGKIDQTLFIKRQKGVNTPRCDEDRLELIELMVFLLPKVENVRVEVSVVDLQVSAVRLILLLLVQKFLLFGLTNWWYSLSAVSSIKYALTVNPNIYVSYIKQFWTTVAVKKVNDVIRLQALVDKKKVIITEVTIRDALRLDDVEGVECLVNEEIFTELAGMGYEKPSTKLTFYKEFFSSYWKFLIHTILQWGMLVAQEVGEDADEVHADDVNAVGAVAEGAASNDVNAAVDEPSIPSPTPPTPPPQPSQDIPSTSQKGIIANIDADEDVILEDAKDAKIEKSADVEDNADIQGRKAKTQAKIYKIDLEHVKKVLSMQEEESEPTKIQEVVDVVTTAKIIIKVVTTASDTITAASTTITATDVPIHAATIAAALTLTAAPPRSKDKGKGILEEEPRPLKKQAQIEQDEKYARELEAKLNKNIDWDEVINHVQRKQKEDKAMKRYQALKRKPQTEAQVRKKMMIYLRNVDGFKIDYFKGMTYDDIRPIFEKHFDSNVAFLQKIKEQMDEKDSRALKRLNESQEDNAAKKQKLDEEVKELKRDLQIVPNNEDDVYIEATPLALKVHVVDYEIYNENNKPYYKIKRIDGTHQLYLSFLSLLRNFDREDLETLWRLVKERFATTKPKNFSDDFLLITLGAMF
nr:retrovirus-related Pol polyprotein from transposon TNT 1-94 [Tanacetum cinerariifolium]